MEQAIRDAGLEDGRDLERAHRHHHGLRRPLDPHHRRGGRHRASQGPEARRPLRGAEGHVLDRLGDARHLVQDQGRELLDLLGLRDLEPLHRQRRRDHPAGQAGRDLRRRLRGARLDLVRPVRRHGRHVGEVQRPAGDGLPRLRRQPRRLRHRRRRGRAGAGGAGARQGPRRPHLRRDRRLRRHLRRLRHGRPLRRGRGALHAHGAPGREGAGRLHQPARHLDAGRRRAGDRGDPQPCSGRATSARRSRRRSR